VGDDASLVGLLCCGRHRGMVLDTYPWVVYEGFDSRLDGAAFTCIRTLPYMCKMHAYASELQEHCFLWCVCVGTSSLAG
jgi:hypothetical protein